MQAVLLAGGLGTRLRGVVPDLPKPMAPVAGRPFLAWLLDRLADAGVERTVLAVGYRHEAISGYFGAHYGGMELHYSVETQALGTGGALRLAADAVTGWPVFVLNGDTCVDLDFARMRRQHDAGREHISIAVFHVEDAARYGSLDIENGHVRRFHEKGRHGPGWINAGVYLLGEEVVRSIPPERPHSFETELLMPQVARLLPAAFETAGLFIDIGVPDDYARAQQLFAR